MTEGRPGRSEPMASPIEPGARVIFHRGYQIDTVRMVA
jgi:hypothetical protein